MAHLVGTVNSLTPLRQPSESSVQIQPNRTKHKETNFIGAAASLVAKAAAKRPHILGELPPRPETPLIRTGTPVSRIDESDLPSPRSQSKNSKVQLLPFYQVKEDPKPKK